jgi:hypothetical protein
VNINLIYIKSSRNSRARFLDVFVCKHVPGSTCPGGPSRRGCQKYWIFEAGINRGSSDISTSIDTGGIDLKESRCREEVRLVTGTHPFHTEEKNHPHPPFGMDTWMQLDVSSFTHLVCIENQAVLAGFFLLS